MNEAFTTAEISTMVDELNKGDMDEFFEIQNSLEADAESSAGEGIAEETGSAESTTLSRSYSRRKSTNLRRFDSTRLRMHRMVERHSEHHAALKESMEEKRKSSSDALKQRLAEKRAKKMGKPTDKKSGGQMRSAERSSTTQHSSMRKSSTLRGSTARVPEHTRN